MTLLGAFRYHEVRYCETNEQRHINYRDVTQNMLAVTLSTVILLCLTAVHANTEKVIFLGPESIQTFTAHPKLQDLNIETISPLSSASSSLRLHLPVAFPFETAPRGIDSWYLLDNLKPWSRYEVRVCWAAIVSL